MDRARKGPRGRSGTADADGGQRLVFTRVHFDTRKPANDNRLGLRGWLERVAALALLIGLAALLAWRVAG